jgi:hypothetical protein
MRAMSKSRRVKSGANRSGSEGVEALDTRKPAVDVDVDTDEVSRWLHRLQRQCRRLLIPQMRWKASRAACLHCNLFRIACAQRRAEVRKGVGDPTEY